MIRWSDLIKKQLKIGTWNLCIGLAMKMNYVKTVLTQNDIDILFLQEIEILDKFDLGLLNITGFVLEYEKRSTGKKKRLVCYIRETISYKRTLEEENSHVIVLKLNPSFSVDNIAGLYRTFKIEENETALLQATNN